MPSVIPYITILEKHTDDNDIGHIYWSLVSEFLQTKGFSVEWDEHLAVYIVPYGIYSDSRKDMIKKIFKLLASKEFLIFRDAWLTNMFVGIRKISLNSMKSDHELLD